MEPERRGPGTRIVEALGRLRDGLLRDNKVLPPVLAALALIIFAWLLAGVIIGDPGEEERVARQAAQPSVAQAPEDGGGSSDTPAPSVENRDNESIDVYESKDPFRELFPPADAAGDDAATGGDTGADAGGTDGTGSGTGSDGSGTGSDGTGSASGTGAGSGGTGDGSGGTGDGSGGTGSGSDGGSGDTGSGSGSDQYGDSGGDDFLDQTSPGDPGFDDGSGSGNGSGSGSGGNGGGSGNGGSGGSGSAGSGQYGDGDGNGNLFDSGGGLGR